MAAARVKSEPGLQPAAAADSAQWALVSFDSSGAAVQGAQRFIRFIGRSDSRDGERWKKSKSAENDWAFRGGRRTIIDKARSLR
jgi:hypothetical protein